MTWAKARLILFNPPHEGEGPAEGCAGFLLGQRWRKRSARVAEARWGSYNPRMAFVYILRCGDGSLYTGLTKNVSPRLKQYQVDQASKYTRAHLPVTPWWTRHVHSWSQALKEERRITALTRRQKEAFLKAAQDPEPAML